jgi:hypothetical protein
MRAIGRELLDVHADVGAERRRVVGIQRRHDDVVVAALVEEVAQRLGARPAALVRGQDRHGGEALLLDDRLEQPGELVRAAARAGHDDHLDGLLRLPALGGGRQDGKARDGRRMRRRR